MTSVAEPSDGVTSPDVTLKYKEILRSNGIMDEVSEVAVKDAGLKGEGMTSQTSCVTVTFKNPDLKQLNLFVKSQVDNPVHTAMVDDMKLFEKEAVFLREYVPAAEEFCKMKGYPGIIDFYPRAFYADLNMIVLENLVLDKGYVLLSKEKKQDLTAAKLSITNIAKHHAISYAMIQDYGGSEKLFQRFRNLDYDISGKASFREMLEPMLLNALNINTGLLEKNNVDGRDQALAELKALLSIQPFDLVLKAVNAPAEEVTLRVLNHGLLLGLFMDGSQFHHRSPLNILQWGYASHPS